MSFWVFAALMVGFLIYEGVTGRAGTHELLFNACAATVMLAVIYFVRRHEEAQDAAVRFSPGDFEYSEFRISRRKLRFYFGVGGALILAGLLYALSDAGVDPGQLGGLAAGFGAVIFGYGLYVRRERIIIRNGRVWKLRGDKVLWEISTLAKVNRIYMDDAEGPLDLWTSRGARHQLAFENYEDGRRLKMMLLQLVQAEPTKSRR